MNINWPNIKAAASASGNVLNTAEVKTNENENDFKTLFASQHFHTTALMIVPNLIAVYLMKM